MAIIFRDTTIRRTTKGQRGMSLIELMIAMLVLLVGGTASTMMIVLALGHNSRSRQQSNSIAIAQMVAAEIASVPAKTAVTRTIVDCTNIRNTVTTAAGGPGVLPSGDIDFSDTALPNYSMLYTDCGSNGTQMTYDVRWNIQTISPYVKLVTISAKMKGGGGDVNRFSLPVTIRTQVGQGT
jgi:prepilin-type N-terminal cleavage/methylation domain-containing protein